MPYDPIAAKTEAQTLEQDWEKLKGCEITGVEAWEDTRDQKTHILIHTTKGTMGLMGHDIGWCPIEPKGPLAPPIEWSPVNPREEEAPCSSKS
jgi:hypothetical protein